MHHAPVSKRKEVKTRLGWVISYKSLYFLHPSLDLVRLFTEMRERYIENNTWSRGDMEFIFECSHRYRTSARERSERVRYGM